jgi:hypothetical protein
MVAISILRRTGLAFAAATLGPALVIAACSSNSDNPTPPNTIYQVDATSTLPDSSTGNQDETSTGGDDGGTGADVKEEPIVREDAQACTASKPAAQGAPTTNASCWNCAPQVNADYLNQCAATGVTCVPFDNSRLPGYDGGALPSTTK